ncbi:D-threo-aldose 1-dehydrogenase [Aliiruegeria haliotis]|uniref:D-threo-aldose 1-dehydrogenase n=1 Tax=Aliiruegeria haliotis TaxID=1280846 RepID=A0A2T0RMU6_9RHOB|nr:aldo/keto reductase [Aliiruegeria haliotis]PRY22478.1 D-threo-aldose 1-dehydrogenase [Aliiruegeria haliotis]
MIETRQIANTDVRVSNVSLGCASLGNLYVEVSEEDAMAVLGAAWNRGIRYFDTAPHYGRGLSEVRLGKFLASKPREDFTVSTKVGRVLTPGKPRDTSDGFINPLPYDVHYDYSAEGIERSLSGSLERLGLDRVGIVYVHDIGTYTHGDENARHLEALLTSGLPHLEGLKKAGKIGAYGLGVNENEICVDIMRRHPIDVILLAGRWTLLDRSAEAELAPLCDTTGTSLVQGGVFNSGILATGPRPSATFNYEPASEEILDKVRRLQAKCEALGVEMPTAALHFCKTRLNVASVLLGTGKVTSLSRNLNALNARLPKAIDQELFDLGRLTR